MTFIYVLSRGSWKKLSPHTPRGIPETAVKFNIFDNRSKCLQAEISDKITSRFRLVWEYDTHFQYRGGKLTLVKRPNRSTKAYQYNTFNKNR